MNPGHTCAECKADVFTADPLELLRVCGQVMCPGYDGRVWPQWYNSARWFENRRREQQEDKERREALPIPE